MDMTDFLYMLRKGTSRGLFAGGCAGAIVVFPAFFISSPLGALFGIVIGLSVGLILAFVNLVLFPELQTTMDDRRHQYVAYLMAAISAGGMMYLFLHSQDNLPHLFTPFLTVLSMPLAAWVARDLIQKYIADQRFNRKQRYYLKHMHRL